MGSLTLDKPLANFIKDYLEKHKIERYKAGKETTIISVIREALCVWAEQKGLTEELTSYLEPKE